MKIMAEENDPVMAEVMNLLEAEPASLPAAVPAPDIPALCEELTILMSPGKMKEAISVDLTHDQVKRLENKEVIKHHKRYQTHVGAKTKENLIESCLTFATKALGLVTSVLSTGEKQLSIKQVIAKNFRSLPSVERVASLNCSNE